MRTQAPGLTGCLGIYMTHILPQPMETHDAYAYRRQVRLGAHSMYNYATWQRKTVHVDRGLKILISSALPSELSIYTKE